MKLNCAVLRKSALTFTKESAKAKVDKLPFPCYLGFIESQYQLPKFLLLCLNKWTHGKVDSVGQYRKQGCTSSQSVSIFEGLKGQKASFWGQKIKLCAKIQLFLTQFGQKGRFLSFLMMGGLNGLSMKPVVKAN